MGNNIKIVMEQLCYQDLLLHILQNGSKGLEKQEQAFGLLYGMMSGENSSVSEIQIKKIIPLKHGSQSDEIFSKKEKDLFTQFDIEHQENGLNCLGYYISHPNQGVYLSSIEKKNLLYFYQEKEIAHAIALICDHAEMENEGNMGIKAMILESPDLGFKTPSQECDVEIATPNDLSIFKISKYLIEKGQTRESYINEYGIGEDQSKDFEIYDDESKKTIQSEFTTEISALVEKLSENVPEFSKEVVNQLLLAFKGYSESLSKLSESSYEVPIADADVFTNALKTGMENLNKWLKETFFEYFEKHMKDYQFTSNMIKKFHISNLKLMTNLLELKIKDSI